MDSGDLFFSANSRAKQKRYRKGILKYIPNNTVKRDVTGTDHESGASKKL
jgi:hypothetical protein